MQSSAKLAIANSGDADVAALADLDRASLARRWTALTGKPPPKRATERLLALALSYEMQLRSSKEAQSAERAIVKALERSVAGHGRSAPPRRISPGARLLREWRGRTLTVDVVNGGFLFEGERYASLSAIARKATGVPRNGPAFFGLRNRDHA